MISVIIPVYRETDEVMHRLRRIADACRDSQAECIIAAVEGDALPGGLSGLPGISLVRGGAGRAAQMNCGAQIARGDMFFFCHADSTPPPDFLRLIDDAVRSGVRIGAFRLRFDGGVRMRITALLTNWRARLSGVPYGDQGIFITRELFAQLGGYAPLPLLEDVDLVRRARKAGARVRILSKAMTTSARRYEARGWLRQMLRNRCIMLRYALGARPETLARDYYRP